MSRIYVGCDVSKGKIDFSIYWDEKFLVHREVKNSYEELNEFVNSVDSLALSMTDEAMTDDIIFAAEYTGIYNSFLVKALLANDLKIALLHPYSIRSVTGINRGKNDVIDSKRIAEYAMRFYDKLQFTKQCSLGIEKIKSLNSLRTLMIKNQSSLTQTLGESKIFVEKDFASTLASVTEKTQAALKLEIKSIDEEIARIIKNDSVLNNTFKLLMSIPGIGKVTATELIIYTDNFTKFENAKKLGSYCGVVPFERSSGIFKGKGRVSKKANKSLKTNLHMGAVSVISRNNPFAEYYARRISEGLHPTSVINAIRNKMLKTAFAIVKNGIPYQKEYIYKAA